jgi:N-acyl-D-aspartate/D-glutamate deacylase
MILTKLQEALAEVDVQRAALSDVEAQLRSMIAKLSGTPISVCPSLTASVPAQAISEGRNRDRLDDMVDILRAEGKPLHITVIAERLSKLTGTEITRTSIEPGVNRHIAKVKKRRIEKFGPSIYGLPEWKQASPQGQLMSVA